MRHTTRTQRLRHRLQESHDRYELVAKATNDVIYDLDIAAGTVFWNDALYHKYGYDRGEPAGSVEWWASHVHPDDALRVEREIGDLMEDNCDTWQSQYRFRKADGSYAVVRDRAFVMRGSGSDPVRIIGSMLDITEAERLDRAKDEFSSLVSHQLRTPLTVIQLYSDMLGSGMAGQLDEGQLAYVRHINDASQRLIKLVGDILHISRIELDRVRFAPEPVRLDEFIGAIVEELQPLAASHNVRLSFKPQPGCPPQPLDKSVFCEVLRNLVTNAIHYSPSGSGRVTVSYRYGRDGCVIRVRDNGIGIPAAAQPHIFDRFYRADNAVDSGSDGTGLGLYLSKLIVDACGGSISFSSTEGKGTVFKVRLPAGTAGPDQPDIGRAAAS